MDADNSLDLLNYIELNNVFVKSVKISVVVIALLRYLDVKM